MRFRAPTLDPGVALAAAMLLALPGSALAEDANPPASDAATPPVAEEVTPPATPEAAPPAAGNASEPAKETNICFTGQGSIKEVLEACAAYIATARPATSSTWSSPTASGPWACPPPAISTAHLPR